ncbi:MAG: adenylate/guanylate cyclase domain-containing protein [Lysobacter sp.]|nr:adenylate/guanylate cyclase domain-containing protein [Lysobacter sp.]
MVPIVLRHGGHANKFIADGMLCIFGAPECHADHAARAVRAAVQIADAVRDRYGDRLRVGVGVNTGRVLVGTVGGGSRLDFTVIGEPVNTAVRIEAVTRQTGGDVLVSGTTLARLDGAHDRFVATPSLPLKSPSQPVALYALTSGTEI